MNCQFCRAEEKRQWGPMEFKCGTVTYIGGPVARSAICYEAEITRKDAQVERAKKVIQAYRALKREGGTTNCVCPSCQELETKTQALITDIETPTNA